MIGAIELHRLSRLGFPFDPLTPLAGRPLLVRTVEAALACPSLEMVAVLAPGEEAIRVEETLRAHLPPAAAGSGGRARKRRAAGTERARWRVLACEGEDIPGRERIRRLRRLAPSSWRAGWAIPYAVAEAGNPRWLLQALDRSGADHLVLFPPSAPFLDAALVEEVIDAAARQPGLQVRLSTAPPGVAGDVLGRALLGDMVRAGAPADVPLRFLPDRPERALENKGLFHWFREEVSGFAARLTAESRRGLAVLEGMAALGPAAGGESLIGRLAARPDLIAGPVPPEVRAWVTRRSRGGSLLDPLPGGAEEDMDLELFRRLADALGRWEECRLVIAGGEPLLHPRAADLLRAARASGVGTVHLETDGRGLDGATVDLLVETADVVSVAIDAVEPATYRALHAADALAGVEEGVGRLLDRAAAAGGWPVVCVEMRLVEENRAEAERFFDRWFPRTPFVVVRGPSDRAGQEPARAVHPARTPKRIPCLRLQESLAVLPDGRAVACENGHRGLLEAGDLRRSSVEEVWRGTALRALREAHAAAAWAELEPCARCGDWCRR